MGEAFSPVLNLNEVRAFLERDFPLIFGLRLPFSVEEIGRGRAMLKLTPDISHLRYGGTVSGASLFTLADLSAFVAIIAHIGPVAMTVTASMNINYLHKPAATTVFAEGKLLRLGKRSAVCEVSIRNDRDGPLLAHATGTFAIPANI